MRAPLVGLYVHTHVLAKSFFLLYCDLLWISWPSSVDLCSEGAGDQAHLPHVIGAIQIFLLEMESIEDHRYPFLGATRQTRGGVEAMRKADAECVRLLIVLLRPRGIPTKAAHEVYELAPTI